MHQNTPRKKDGKFAHKPVASQPPMDDLVIESNVGNMSASKTSPAIGTQPPQVSDDKLSSIAPKNQDGIEALSPRDYIHEEVTRLEDAASFAVSQLVTDYQVNEKFLYRLISAVEQKCRWENHLTQPDANLEIPEVQKRRNLRKRVTSDGQM